MTTPDTDPEAKLIAAMAQAIKDKCTTYGGPVTEWHEMAASALAAFRKYPEEEPPDDPKVKELLEAAKDAWPFIQGHVTEKADRLFDALAAFDPPKLKQYTMPEWEEFCKTRTMGWQMGYNDEAATCTVRIPGGSIQVEKAIYNAIREATTKE